jgi:hypothetical protein
MDGDVRSHPLQFTHVNKPVFENGFSDDAGSLCNAHQSHELRLEIGRKTRERHRFNIDTPDLLRATDKEPLISFFNDRSHQLELLSRKPDVRDGSPQS